MPHRPSFWAKNRANDYLEKIIQVRLDLPQLTDKQKVDLVDASLEVVRTNNDIIMSEKALQSIAALWTETLSLRLSTPRTIRRFFAQVDASYVTVAQEVSFEDFLALTFLRTHEHRVYSEIQNRADELTMQGFRPYRHESPKEQLERWKERLRDWEVSEDNLQGVLQLLSRLFLPIRSALSGMEYSTEWLGDIARKKGVGHADYFTRYFFFGVPDGDIPDSAIAWAMNKLSDPSGAASAAETLSQALKSDSDRIIRKIRNFGTLNECATKRLLQVLADIYLDVPNNIGFLSSHSRASLEALAEDLLKSSTIPSLPDMADQLSQSDGGYCLTVRGLRRAIVRARRGDRVEESNGFNLMLIEVISNKFRELHDAPIEGIEQTVFGTVHQWMEADKESAQAFLRNQVETGKWQLLQILEKLVNRGTSTAHTGILLMGLEGETVEAALGLNYVFDRLSREIDTASTDVLMEGMPDTPENRRSVALAALSFARQRMQGDSN
ncbi:P-loop NTPase fold protein [Streptomyces sp. NPDC001770]